MAVGLADCAGELSGTADMHPNCDRCVVGVRDEANREQWAVFTEILASRMSEVQLASFTEAWEAITVETGWEKYTPLEEDEASPFD
jgi:hypothetical protein